MAGGGDELDRLGGDANCSASGVVEEAPSTAGTAADAADATYRSSSASHLRARDELEALRIGLDERERRKRKRREKKKNKKVKEWAFKIKKLDVSPWGSSIEALPSASLPFEMSSRELFFDAVDMNAVKAEHDEARLGGPDQEAGARREEGREGRDDGAIDGAALLGQRAAQQPAAAATAFAAPPLPPPASNPITASELRLAASAALRLAVEAIDALHALKEAVFDMAGDVRELLEATKRAGGGGGGFGGSSSRRGRGRSASSARRSGGGGLGVRTRAQARRRR